MKAITLERRNILERLGLDPNDVKAWVGKWSNLKGDAKGSGKGCNLTFEQYVITARNSGLRNPTQIGQRSSEYCMARIGDSGPYEFGKCRFITQSQNQRERQLNGGARVAGDKCSITKGLAYRVVSPDGEVFEGVNLSKFCRENGLNEGCMKAVCRGKDSHHKGWKGSYK